MSSVMMDRWGLDCAIEFLRSEGSLNPRNCSGGFVHHYYSHFFEGLSPDDGILSKAACLAIQKKIAELARHSWENFLTAIVLWDEIWSCEKYTYDWHDLLSSALANDLDNIIHQIDTSMLDAELRPIYCEITTYPFTYYDYPFAPDPLTSMSSMSSRTKIYQILSHSLGVPYLAHPHRTIMFKPPSIFSRNDIIENIDKELTQYYKELNKRLGRDLYKFKYPVLIDLIVKRADSSSPKEQLLTALELRKEPDLVAFRHSMCEIEQIVHSGDTQLMILEMDRISELAKEITTKYKKKLTLGELTIFLTRLPEISLEIPLKSSYGGAPHVTFIRRLLKYGVYERPL